MLAGVSVSWYTWLEQGRDIQASADTLRRVSDVLKLDRVEASYLFALSSRGPPQFPDNQQVSAGLRMLLHTMDPNPAYIRNTRLDILAWNSAVTGVFADYGAMEPHERNTLRLLFLYPPYRKLILDWEVMARGMLGMFRGARARALDKRPFDELVDELSRASPEFRDWWPNADVSGFDEGRKRLRHPRLGIVEFTYVAVTPEGQPDLALTVYITHAAASRSASSGTTTGTPAK